MPGDASTKTAAAAPQTVPPVHESAPNPKAPIDKKEKTKKEDALPLSQPSSQVNLLNSKDGMNRKHIKLGDSLYYVVSLDEIDRYMELKDEYKTDAMSAFVVYMHEEFITDLKSLRRKRSMKKGIFALIVIFSLIFIALGLVAITR